MSRSQNVEHCDLSVEVLVQQKHGDPVIANPSSSLLLTGSRDSLSSS